MASHDGRYVISFNGEIYNFIELKEELSAAGHRFVSNSDTEVVIEGYRRWGTNVGNRLRGMYAFAIYDRREAVLFLARDRFGEKPLFIREEEERITFGSELGAFCCLGNFETRVDHFALGAYLCLNYVPGEMTLLSSIRRLGPGCWRLYDTKGVRDGRHTSETLKCDQHAPLDKAVSRVGDLLDESVKITLRSDVPVSLFLSGGIDSSLIAESAVRQGKIDTAYCLDFQESGFSEFSLASQVGQRLGIDVIGVPMGAESIEDFFDVVGHMDDPLADSSALAVWCLSRRASQDYKVVLSGDGGDELFGGYLTYKATAIHNMLAYLPLWVRRMISAAASSIPVTDGKVTATYKIWRFLRANGLNGSEAHFTWNGTWLPNEAVSFLSEDIAPEAALGSLHRLAAGHNLTDSPSTGALQQADTRDYLPNDILTKVDRTTMAFGLESRAPMLYEPLADFGLSLPDRHKVTPLGQSKHVLRTLAEKRLGHDISSAKKQGFSIPVQKWLRADARPILEDLLGLGSLKNVSFLNPTAVMRAKDVHLSGKRQYGFELWGLMVLVAWYRARIERRGFNRPTSELRRANLALESVS